MCIVFQSGRFVRGHRYLPDGNRVLGSRDPVVYTGSYWEDRRLLGAAGRLEHISAGWILVMRRLLGGQGSLCLVDTRCEWMVTSPRVVVEEGP